MAIDQAMVQFAAQQQLILLRIYRWSSPTLSLGYFQNAADRQAYPGLGDIPCVRRVTGGGAILHHHEWTYSVAFPESGPRKGHAENLYQGIHRALAEWLRDAGYPVSFSGPEQAAAASTEPFLCFERRSPLDLVLAGDKVCGSAQRRTAAGILQHGSLVLARSPLAPHLPGLGRFAEQSEPRRLPERIEGDGMAAAIRKGMEATWDVSWSEFQGVGSLHTAARSLDEGWFSDLDWTVHRKRHPLF